MSLELLEIKLEFLEKLNNERFLNYEKAIAVALDANDKRLDGMNAFREQLRDQAADFLTRTEYKTAHDNLIKTNQVAHDNLVKTTDQLKIIQTEYSTRLESLDKSGSVERAQLDKRLESMNEFRGQLKDQAANFVIRQELSAKLDNHYGKITKLELDMTSKIGTDEHEKLENRTKDVERKLANWDGRLWALGSMFLLINIFVSWYLSGIHLGFK